MNSQNDNSEKTKYEIEKLKVESLLIEAQINKSKRENSNFYLLKYLVAGIVSVPLIIGWFKTTFVDFKEVERLKAENESLKAENKIQRTIKEMNKLEMVKEKLETEKDELGARKNELENDKIKLESEKSNLENERWAIALALSSANHRNDSLVNKLNITVEEKKRALESLNKSNMMALTSLRSNTHSGASNIKAKLSLDTISKNGVAPGVDTFVTTYRVDSWNNYQTRQDSGNHQGIHHSVNMSDD